MSETKKGYLLGITAALIWCGFILVSRMGGISELTSYDVIAIRYLTCASLLLPLWWFKWRFTLFTIKNITASLIGGLAYALCAFKGFEMAPASHAAVLLPGVIPLLVIVLAFWVNHEAQGKAKWLGLAVIALGIAMLFVQQLSPGGEGVQMGHVWLVLGAAFWALFTVLIKRWNISPWQAMVSLAVITSMLYLPVYVLLLPSKLSVELLPDIALQVVYQGVVATIIQMYLYVRAVQLIGASAMGSVMAIVPVVSGVLALFVFKEPISIELVVGLVLVSLGAWLTHSKWLSERNMVRT